jgi:hypothetical protein
MFRGGLGMEACDGAGLERVLGIREGRRHRWSCDDGELKHVGCRDSLGVEVGDGGGDVFDEGEESLDLEKGAQSGEARLDPGRRPVGEVGASADGGLRLRRVSGRNI